MVAVLELDDEREELVVELGAELEVVELDPDDDELFTGVKFSRLSLLDVSDDFVVLGEQLTRINKLKPIIEMEITFFISFFVKSTKIN